MKIAVAGKGGSGKTSLAGTLARLLSREGLKPLVAIDADSNPNLSLTLGLPAERRSEFAPLPRSVLKRETDQQGKTRVSLAEGPDAIIRRYGVPAPDGVTLLLMASVDHAGAG